MKLLGIKTTMTYDVIHQGFHGIDKSSGKSNNRNWSNSSLGRSCKYCGKSHSRGNCPAYGKKCQKCGKDNHFKSVCKNGNANSDQNHSSRSRPKKKGKGKKFHKVTENNNEMDDLADQVQSVFDHDVHFNSINTRMHTKLECEMFHVLKTSETFQIDTGANGNLMPITMFMKFFPKISLETLGRTIEQGVILFAYNNMQIKQFGICSMKILFKGKQAICKFYVVEYNTMIIGIADSETLGLVNVNFDAVEKENLIKVIHNVVR